MVSQPRIDNDKVSSFAHNTEWVLGNLRSRQLLSTKFRKKSILEGSLCRLDSESSKIYIMVVFASLACPHIGIKVEDSERKMEILGRLSNLSMQSYAGVKNSI